MLNLLSLTAAFGIVVFIFQWGYGSSLWNIDATQAIPAWIPLMIFAFLFGLSMDYEVFMLSRMREAYDETARTTKRRSSSASPARGSSSPAAPRSRLRLPRPFLQPGRRDQAVRDRPGGGDHLRCDRHPRPARAVADGAVRTWELVDAQLDQNILFLPRRERLPEAATDEQAS